LISGCLRSQASLQTLPDRRAVREFEGEAGNSMEELVEN